MTKLHLDFETKSEVDLKKHGLNRYARGVHADIMCMGFAFGESEVELWKSGDATPDEVVSHVKNGGTVVAHNAPFELEIWNVVGRKKYGWPTLHPEQTFCTMAMAYSMGLPGSLEKLAPALGIDHKKDMEGNRVMLQLSKPRSEKDNEVIFYTKEEFPEKFEKMFSYCKQDVEVEREAEKRMVQLTNNERSLWLLDHVINQRGVQIDMKAVKVAIEIVEIEKKKLDGLMRYVTGNGVATCTANGQLVEWLKFNGVETESVSKDVVKKLLKTILPPNVREALLLRQEAAKSSTAKLVAMFDRAGIDGRVRHTAQFHGAGTGRWSGRGIQVQNFPRPNMKQEEIEDVMELLNK